MTARTSRMTQEIAVAAIASCLISVVGAAVTFYITGQLQAQSIATIESGMSDHETRIRTVETLLTRIDSNVQWLKEQQQRKNP